MIIDLYFLFHFYFTQPKVIIQTTDFTRDGIISAAQGTVRAGRAELIINTPKADAAGKTTMRLFNDKITIDTDKVTKIKRQKISANVQGRLRQNPGF